MGTHGVPWVPMGTHGNPWEPMDFPWINFPWIFHELSGRPEADKKCGGVWGTHLAQKAQKRKNRFFHKNLFFHNLNCIWEVWGCPGACHGPYEAVPSNFGGVWSYMAWGKSIFMFLGNIGNSGPPDWCSDLFESQGTISGAIKQFLFILNDHTKNIFRETGQPPQIVMFC